MRHASSAYLGWPNANTRAPTMTFQQQTLVGAVLGMVVCGAAQLGAGQTDVVTRARALAVVSHRVEAIELLEKHLAGSPRDSDARVLLGTVLSWEGRYDEARRELEAVLTQSPTHGDALPAMINVELWSNHPDRAEELTRRGLRQRPTDPHYLLARARALVALKRSNEARDVLERLLTIDPRNAEGEQMRRSIQKRLHHWQARVGASYDAFSDHRVAWRDRSGGTSGTPARMSACDTAGAGGAKSSAIATTSRCSILTRVRPRPSSSCAAASSCAWAAPTAAKTASSGVTCGSTRSRPGWGSASNQ